MKPQMKPQRARREKDQLVREGQMLGEAIRGRMPGPPLGGGMWGRGVGPGDSAYSRESMMIVFTAESAGWL